MDSGEPSPSAGGENCSDSFQKTLFGEIERAGEYIAPGVGGRSEVTDFGPGLDVQGRMGVGLAIFSGRKGGGDPDGL